MKSSERYCNYQIRMNSINSIRYLSLSYFRVKVIIYGIDFYHIPLGTKKSLAMKFSFKAFIDAIMPMATHSMYVKYSFHII